MPGRGGGSQKEVIAHGQAYFFFKTETSSPPVANGSTELGGRHTRWEDAMRMMII